MACIASGEGSSANISRTSCFGSGMGFVELDICWARPAQNQGASHELFPSPSDDDQSAAQLLFADLPMPDHPLGAPHKLPEPTAPILILTPLKNSASYLPAYFTNLARLSYPKHLISLAFLVSDSTDSTFLSLKNIASSLAEHGIGPKREKYRSITVLRRDFHFELASSFRHAYESQPVRRSFLARARNYLLTTALDADHEWVLWLDSDVVRYDPMILRDLIALDKDVITPNCLWLKDDWEFWSVLFLTTWLLSR